jgi:hypothetical protein
MSSRYSNQVNPESIALYYDPLTNEPVDPSTLNLSDKPDETHYINRDQQYKFLNDMFYYLFKLEKYNCAINSKTGNYKGELKEEYASALAILNSLNFDSLMVIINERYWPRVFSFASYSPIGIFQAVLLEEIKKLNCRINNDENNELVHLKTHIKKCRKIYWSIDDSSNNLVTFHDSKNSDDSDDYDDSDDSDDPDEILQKLSTVKNN